MTDSVTDTASADRTADSPTDSAADSPADSAAVLTQADNGLIIGASDRALACAEASLMERNAQLEQQVARLEQQVAQLSASLAASNAALQHAQVELAASQRQARLNEERLLSITDNLNAAIGQIDREGNFVFLNPRAARPFGKPVEELVGQNVKLAHTEEKFRLIEPYYEEAMRGKKVTFELEMQIDGKQRFVHASYLPALDKGGAPDGFVAMALDITARKQSEIGLRESEERLRTITDNLPVLIAYIDRDLTYRFANARYEQWHGVAPREMIGRTIAAVFGPGFLRARERMIERCMAGETVEIDSDIALGNSERVLHTVFIPHLRDGEVVGAYALSDDVTAARRQEVSLRELAHTDALTGLPNRRSYESELAAAVKRAQRLTQPLALMYLDIDRFKAINDSMGHAHGDAVLKAFGARLKAAVRGTDMLFRLAGDEFTIIVENVRSQEECAVLGQKVIDAMAAPLDIAGGAWPVSASVGIAWSGDADPVARRLSLDADAALYKAKAAGRNCYVMMK